MIKSQRTKGQVVEGQIVGGEMVQTLIARNKIVN